MKKLLSTRPLAINFALLLLRVGVFSFMVFAHGWGKFTYLTGNEPIDFYDFMGIGQKASLVLAVFGELICGVFILLGLFTRLATIPMLLTMLVAALGAHSDSIFGEGEHALLFAVIAVVLFFTGPGKYSADKLIFK